MRGNRNDLHKCIFTRKVLPALLTRSDEADAQRWLHLVVLVIGMGMTKLRTWWENLLGETVARVGGGDARAGRQGHVPAGDEFAT